MSTLPGVRDLSCAALILGLLIRRARDAKAIQTVSDEIARAFEARELRKVDGFFTEDFWCSLCCVNAPQSRAVCASTQARSGARASSGQKLRLSWPASVSRVIPDGHSVSSKRSTFVRMHKRRNIDFALHRTRTRSS